MTDFLQFAIIGTGAGAAYALFAQGVVLIYRGSGIVNFGHGALGMLGAYTTFVELRAEDHRIGVAIAAGVVVTILVALLFQVVVLRLLAGASPITRVIATLGLLAIVQAAVEQRYGRGNQAIDPFLPSDTFSWGGIRVQEQVLYVMAIAGALTAVLWAFTKFTRVGLAITAAAQNERAVQTLGWSPDRLSAITWAIGGCLAAVAGILVAPLTGLSPVGFTLVVTVASLAAALLGGFRSFPLTLLGGLVVGVGEALVTLYRDDIERFFQQSQITGLNRAVPFLIILLVLVVRGRGLPVRGHVTDQLPRLGSGKVNAPALVAATGTTLLLVLFVFDDRWAAATFISLAGGIVILSVVVLTGYAGQLSLGQWALAGTGALLAGSLVHRGGWPMELAIPAGVLLTVPVGIVFALPALRARGVNLAVVTLGLGFTVAEVVFQNGRWIGDVNDGGTRIGQAELFGIAVDGATHPHRYAIVCLGCFLLTGLVVANLRRSRTGSRLIAVRTNERAAASLGISVFGVKLYAFGLAAAIAGLGGILVGFQSRVVTYERYGVLDSVTAVGHAVIGGVGFVTGAAFGAPNTTGGLLTRVMDNVFGVGEWAGLLGGIALVLMLVTQHHGIAAVSAQLGGRVARRISRRPPARKAEIPEVPTQVVVPASLVVDRLCVQFGNVIAVDDVSFEVQPGEVVGLIGPNGAGKTTIIDAVTGFVPPSAGSIVVGDARIDRWSAGRRARSGLRRSFQSLELFEGISVGDNIRSGSEVAPSRASWLTDLIWPIRPSLAPAAAAAIREFNLIDHLGKVPDELAYGERRLVGIARAIASAPSIVLLDEPAAGLDAKESAELARLIRRMAEERGMGVLVVEHDVNLVMSVCDRILVVDFGSLIASGTPAEVRSDPAVRAAYLGTTADVDSLDSKATVRPTSLGVIEQ